MKTKTKSHPTVGKQHTYTQRICNDKRCKFYGKQTVQGVCYATDGNLVEWAKLDAEEKDLIASLKDIRKSSKSDKDYVRALEAYYISAMMNWEISLDETLRLRRQNALLKEKK